MTEGRGFDQHGQTVRGPQTNIVDAKGQVFSGNITYNEAAKIRLPLQKPPRAQHFLGREDELSSLLNDLQPGRVVTICGPGGMGKTALAAEAVWQLSPGNEPPKRFPDGIVFHTFYHKPQAALALEAIALAYGEDPRPNYLQAAIRALAGRQALIVLDGTESCNDLETVLSAAASCGVLITTRRHSDAPANFSDLRPLPTDKAVQLLQAWGGELALDREVSERICILLGGLPLAIFLVGRYMAHRLQYACDYLNWLEKTPLAALNLGERQHQSIPLLMDHSLAQVSDLAKSCFGLTGILAMKPFESEIVIVALEISTEEANLSLGELVEFGLLTRSDSCYQMIHALAHTYARAKLAPPCSALFRLANHYNNFIGKQTQLRRVSYALLDAHRDHILAVQSACSNAKQWKTVRTLTWAIENYLDLQGHFAERIAVLQVGLEASHLDRAQYDEASFLNFLGLSYADLGEDSKAIEYYEQALEIFRKIGERQGEGAALGNQGIAYKNLGDYHKAIEYNEQALTISRKIGDRMGEGADIGNLGLTYSDMGRTPEAIEYYMQHLVIARETRDKRGEGNALDNLGNSYFRLGHYSYAIRCYEQHLAIAREIGDRRGEGIALGNMGCAYHVLGKAPKAIDFYEQYLTISRGIGDRRGEGIALGNMGNACAALHDFEKAIRYYWEALAIAYEIDDKRNEGVWLGNLGNAYFTLGNSHWAFMHYEQALAISRQIGDRMGEANALRNLGLAYNSIGESKKAIEFHEQALAVARGIGDRRTEINALGNLGLAYASLGDTEKAIKFHEQVQTAARKICDQISEGADLGLFKKFNESMNSYEPAIQFFSDKEDIYRMACIQARNSLKAKNLDMELIKAIENYDSALQISNTKDIHRMACIQARDSLKADRAIDRARDLKQGGIGLVRCLFKKRSKIRRPRVRGKSQ